MQKPFRRIRGRIAQQFKPFGRHQNLDVMLCKPKQLCRRRNIQSSRQIACPQVANAIYIRSSVRISAVLLFLDTVRA